MKAAILTILRGFISFLIVHIGSWLYEETRFQFLIFFNPMVPTSNMMPKFDVSQLIWYANVLWSFVTWLALLGCYLLFKQVTGRAGGPDDEVGGTGHG